MKRYASSAEYLRGDEPLFTDLRAQNVASVLADDYAERARWNGFSRSATFSYPDRLINQFQVVFNAVGVKVAEEAAGNMEANPSQEDIEFDDPGLMELPNESDEERQTRQERLDEWREQYELWDPYSGGVNVDKLIDLMLSGRRIDQWYVARTTYHATAYKPDLMSLEFQAADTERPIVRLCIGLLFAVGFALLAVPTIFTFYAVLRQTL